MLEFQQRRFEDEDEHDGIAGIGTQRELMKVIARKATRTWDLPKGCPYGHCEKESGGINSATTRPAIPTAPGTSA